MMIKSERAPFLKREENVSSMMKNMLLALCCLLILPTIFYGAQPIWLAVSSVAACAVAEILCCLMSQREINISEASPAVTGMIIALLMPVDAPLWLPITAACFAIFVVRAPFGFTGRTPFNPAAAGVAFVTICFPEQIFHYRGVSPAAALKNGFKPEMFPFDMLFGKTAGPVGATAVLVIAACALYLFVRRAASWQISLGFVVAAAVFAALFPRIPCAPLVSAKYELLSGSLLFCAVFMMTEPVTAPRTIIGSSLYGVLGGILLMLFRRFGVYEQGACFVVLLMNAVAPVIDRCVCAVKVGRVLKRETDK